MNSASDTICLWGWLVQCSAEDFPTVVGDVGVAYQGSEVTVCQILLHPVVQN